MSDLQLLACEPREARSTRSILRHARELAVGDVRAVFGPLRAQTSIRIRSVPGNGLAGVTASQKGRCAGRMTTAAPSGCIVRNPERGLSAHGGKSMQRNWMIVAALAASVAACGPNTSQ